MRRRTRALVAVVVAAGVAFLFLAPVIPAEFISRLDFSETGLHVPSNGASSSGWGRLTDPSGTYWFYTLDMTCQETTCYTTTAMNLTSFKQLQNDPYSTSIANDPSCKSAIQGSVILITCPQSRCAPNNLNREISCMPITPATNGLDSIAYWLVRHGTVFYGGEYVWR